MTRNKEYHTRVPKTLNFEMNVYEEFEELCKKESISISKKIQSFMVDEIQKNPSGDQTPIKITYRKQQNKPTQSVPITLDQWIHKLKTMESIPEIGRIQGFHKTVAEKCKMRIYQLKSRGVGL